MTINGGFIAPDSYQNLTETDRQFLKHIAGDTQGVVGANDFKVIPSSGLTLHLTGPGRAFLAGLNTVGQGFYMAWITANEVFALTPAHVTLPRIDRVVLAVRDSQYGELPAGTQNGPALLVIAGTPAASPTAATDSAVTSAVGPGAWIELGRVAVAAGATSIAAGNITDSRTYSAAGRSPTMQVFTNSGTYTKPPGARSVRVRCVGGGGAGGGAAATSSSSQASVGGGGGGGGYAESLLAASGLAASVAVTVGNGGTGVAGDVGNNGQASSFGSLVVAGGGLGGPLRGSHAFTDWLAASGGRGGAGTTGQILVRGGPGGIGFVTEDVAVPGSGGNSALGGGYPSVTTSNADVVDNGDPGDLYGGGGSGGVNKQTHSARVGGAGGKGVVIVETFYS
jgi:hypothetical protein